jgi:hypothetical protein
VDTIILYKVVALGPRAGADRLCVIGTYRPEKSSGSAAVPGWIIDLAAVA